VNQLRGVTAAVGASSKQTSWPQDAICLTNGHGGVLEVVEDPQRGNSVEGGIWKRESRCVAGYGGAGRAPRQLGCGSIEADPGHAVSKVVSKLSPPATDVEDRSQLPGCQALRYDPVAVSSQAVASDEAEPTGISVVMGRQRRHESTLASASPPVRQSASPPVRQAAGPGDRRSPRPGGTEENPPVADTRNDTAPFTVAGMACPRLQGVHHHLFDASGEQVAARGRETRASKPLVLGRGF
jgi:hypothetical protein